MVGAPVQKALQNDGSGHRVQPLLALGTKRIVVGQDSGGGHGGAALIPQHDGHTRGVGQALGKAAALVGTAALGAVHVLGQTADEALGSAGGKDLGHSGGDLVHAFFFDLRRDGGGNGLPGVAPGKPGAGIAIVNGKPFHGQAPLLCYIQVL